MSETGTKPKIGKGMLALGVVAFLVWMAMGLPKLDLFEEDPDRPRRVEVHMWWTPPAATMIINIVMGPNPQTYTPRSPYTHAGATRAVPFVVKGLAKRGDTVAAIIASSSETIIRSSCAIKVDGVWVVGAANYVGFWRPDRCTAIVP